MPWSGGSTRAAGGSSVSAPGQAKGRFAEPPSFASDLTEQAARGELEPVIGRDDLIARLIEVLACRTKSNALLVGEAGVGKTAVVEGLAQRIAAGEVPRFLLDRRVWALDLGALVAGTRHRGDLEERVRALLDCLASAAGAIVLFIDELHLVTAGSPEASPTVGGLLKPALARGRFGCIGATTPAERRRHLDRDSALTRRFQPILVEEPDAASCVAMLKGRRPRDEAHHRAQISNEAIEAAVHLSCRAVPERRLPDKAVDAIDQATARVRLAAERAGRIDLPTVEADDVKAVLRDWTGVSIGRLDDEERDRLGALEETLGRDVLGQEPAIHRVASVLRRARAGLRDPGRPRASFLFVGPPGVGKTRLAGTIARALDGDPREAQGGGLSAASPPRARSLVRLDLGEYLERHTAARLVGAPPGYVGHDEGGQLTDAVRRRPASVVLLDEIDKAHPDVVSVLLSLVDEGRLTDGQGRSVEFRETVLIMTMNRDDAALATREALCRRFHPAFIDRIDEVIWFPPLPASALADIARRQLQGIARLARARGVELILDEESLLAAALAIASEAGAGGARPIARAVEAVLAAPLSDAIVAGEIQPGDIISVTARDGLLCYKKK